MNKNLILLFVLVILSFKLHAQDEGGHENGSRTQAKDSITAYLRGTTVTIDNQIFDYRVLKYYPENILRGLDPIKRKQIFIIYNQSYSVTDLSSCADLKEYDIDIARLESNRLEDSRITVEYGKNCNVHVQLLSRKELNVLLNAVK